MATSLSSSRWAPTSMRRAYSQPRPPRTNEHNPSSTNIALPTQQRPSRPFPLTTSAKRQFPPLLRRLHHKSHLLLYSQSHALTSPITVSIDSLSWPLKPGEAEVMFRVDFFEWYALLERCLVIALEAVGVEVGKFYAPATDIKSIARDEARVVNGDGEGGTNERHRSVEGSGILGDSNAFPEGNKHRFHANVLEALDTADGNPLYAILGHGKVRGYIGVAKEFRNQWKDVLHKETVANDDGGFGREEVDDEERLRRRLRRYQDIMRGLKLEGMIASVLAALGEVKVVLERNAADFGSAGRGEEDMEVDMTIEIEMDDEMDAMELG